MDLMEVYPQYGCLGCFSFWVCLEKLWSILAQATDVCWPQLAFLAVFDTIQALGHERASWILVKMLNTEMLGSRETHQAWIFRRIAP
jgi:hypothetical protein